MEFTLAFPVQLHVDKLFSMAPWLSERNWTMLELNQTVQAGTHSVSITKQFGLVLHNLAQFQMLVRLTLKVKGIKKLLVAEHNYSLSKQE